MPTTHVRSLTPVLMVERVEPSVAFWTSLGFATTAEVPEGDRLGFVILERDGVQLMYQSRASVEKDLPTVVPEAHRSLLFVEVDDVEAVAKTVGAAEILVPRRRTFYGMDEIGVREPGGHVVVFAQRVAGEA